MTTEQEICKDLNICGYAGKWAKAKDYINRHNPNIPKKEYWDKVRTHYLELGGEYLHQRCPEIGGSAIANPDKMPIMPPYNFRTNVNHYKIRQG